MTSALGVSEFPLVLGRTLRVTVGCKTRQDKRLQVVNLFAGLEEELTDRRLDLKTEVLSAVSLWILFGAAFVSAQTQIPAGNSTARSAQASPAEASTIPPGTAITASNWRDYKQFMPDGMIALFEGKYFWKMPADIRMEVGSTVVRQLPANYTAATERYAAQVKLIELPGGGLSLSNYRAGLPFPDPSEPHMGWKILADVWYRYVPHLTVDTYGTACAQNSFGNISCTTDELVTRQLSYNTDPGVPETLPEANGNFYSEWIMTLEPENQRYTASLVLSPTDLTKPQQIYAFIPSLRRPQPVSPSARCTPYPGTDLTTDEYRFGFNGNLSDSTAEALGTRKILALLDINVPDKMFPDGYDMPLGWAMPSWSKWQVRDVYQISASKLPAQLGSYCYGKRVMYIDKSFYSTYWEDLYDKRMNLMKFAGFMLATVNVPGVGAVNSSNSAVEGIWDFESNHSTILVDPGLNRPFYVNEQAPAEYKDVDRYTTVNGLSQILR